MNKNREKKITIEKQKEIKLKNNRIGPQCENNNNNRKDFLISYSDDIAIVSTKDRIISIVEKMGEYLLEFKMRLNEKKAIYFAHKMI